MKRSVIWRVAVPYIILAIIAVGGLGLFFTIYTQDLVTTNGQQSLLSEARLLSSQIAPYLGSDATPDQIDSLADNASALIDARVTIILIDGTVVGESDHTVTEMENHLDRPEVQQALNGEEGTATRFSRTIGMTMLYIAEPIESNDQIIGVARLSVPYSTIQANIDTIRNFILGIIAITIFLVILLAYLITRVTLQPLRQLTVNAHRISQGDFSGVETLQGRQDEFGALNHAFQKMAGQIKSQIQQFQAEQGKLTAVLSTMTDGIIIADADGNVQLLNQAAIEMFDTGGDDYLGRSLIEVTRQYQLVDLWQKAHTSHDSQTITLEIGTDRIFLQVIATTLDPAIPGATLIIMQDLTRLRKLETVRQDFVSNVSHELRTPLASLKALVETLQEGALTDPPAARRFLTHMDTEIDNLTQMVQELLELSRIESGKVPLVKKMVHPCTLIKSAVDRMNMQAKRAGLTLITECPNELPEVRADAERIEQVFMNLIHNAIKFTPPGGKITVTAKTKEKEVIFQVTDTGVGIAPDDLSRIFERFFKADRARSGKGTGLGLSISRHLIEAHGGRIWAESQELRGSTFYFSLPMM
ncbi:MAG TPA: ATP-binding protein [Longilinea sp.]|nr:ATP-binding protein [Longilinea sp.]